MKKVVKLSEGQLNRIIKESVKSVLNEMNYDGVKHQEELMSHYGALAEQDENYKQNLKLYKQAFQKVSKDYPIIRTLKSRKSTPHSEALKFSWYSFEKWIKSEMGDALYEKIWEDSYGDYEEAADQYIQYILQRFNI